MSGLKTETFGTGDQRWLGSTRGIAHARSGSIDISSLTEADHYPDGYIKSGIPVKFDTDGETYVPWTTGATLEGFVLADVPINGDDAQNVAVLDDGRINVLWVPVIFDPTDITTNGTFSFVGTQEGS